jgi:hypothetical protein
MFKLFFSLFVCFSIFTQTIFAQDGLKQDDNSIKSTWENFQDLKQKGLAQDEVKFLDSMLIVSVKQNNASDFYVSLTEYNASLSNSFFEKEQKYQILENFEKLATEMKAPFSNMLHDFLAKQYHIYTDAWDLNEWQGDFEIKCIVDGKQILFSNTDKKLQREIILNHYRLSVAPDLAFSNLALNAFLKDQTEIYYIEFPSLLDYFVNSYLIYLQADQNKTLPMFDVKTASSLFGSSKTHASEFEDEIMQLFARMESFNLEKKKVYAYVNWRLMRMEYVNEKLNHLDNVVRSDIYLKALADFKEELIQNFKNHPAILKVILKESEVIASDERNQYNWKTNPAAKDQRRKEYDLINQGLSNYPTSRYADMAKLKLSSISSKRMTVNYQNQNLTSKSGLLTVNYQNIPKAYLAVFHVDQIKDEKFLYNRLKNFDLSSVYEQDLVLETNGEFNFHSKDFIIPALKKIGKYLITIADSKENLFKMLDMDTIPMDNSFAYAEINLSNIAVFTHIDGVKATWLVQDNKEGLPLAGVSIFGKSSFRSNVYEKRSLLGKTDAKGIFTTAFSQSTDWLVVHKNDSVTGYSYIYLSQQDIKRLINTKIITDRTIYRPGQKVYFKFYAYEGELPNFKVSQKYKTTLILEDANGIEFGKIEVETNEFGTASGFFNLPKSGFLPGTFEINDSKNLYDGTAYINVEEYKRPSFEVIADFEKKVYQVNDEVKVSGTVKAYSGFGLKDVKLHILVESSYSYWRSYNQAQTSVLDTVISSNAQGEFSFAFIAKSNDSRYGSNFSYSIAATSLAGETNEVSNSIFIGKTKAEWALNFPADVLSINNERGTVSLINADSTDAAKTINIELWKSNPKSNAIFRFYEPKEFHDFSEKAFNKQFENSIYGKEADYVNYQKVKSITVQAGDSISINDLVDQKAGTYQVRLISDDLDSTNLKDGNTNPYVATFNYISAKSKKNQHNSKIWVVPSTKSAKVGEEISFIVGSSYKKLNAIIELYRGDKLIFRKNEKIKGRKTINHKLQYADLGGITMLVRAVINGEFLSAESEVRVPFDELKNVDIKLETERTILRPGDAETWKMIVSTKDGTPITAEGVATLTDASLKVFGDNRWNMDIYENHYFNNRWTETKVGPSVYFRVGEKWNGGYGYRYGGSGSVITRDNIQSLPVRSASSAEYSLKGSGGGSEMESMDVVGYTKPLIAKDGGALVNLSGGVPANYGDISGGIINIGAKEIKPRTNMNETAFFYPTLYSNADNEFKIEFTLPDALTSWDFQTLFHDKTMRFGTYTQNFVAQKELMIQPNAPRFFRAGDEVEFASNVVNMSDEAQDVTISLEWFDPFTNEILPNVFGKLEKQTLTLNANENQAVFWKLTIPKSGTDIVAYRIRVSSAKFSDTEEKVVPVLSNRTQVIESVPVTIESKGTYTFDLPKLSNPTSTTQINQSLTLEYNANPIWSVVMAVPYVMDQRVESADQIFNTYFINQLSKRILEKNPAIEQVLTLAVDNNPDLFLSALEKNPELKDIILAETPWILDAKSENAQKKRISELFNSNNLEMQEVQLLTRLELLKNNDGGWSWFGNDKSNVYITQYILSGLAYLKSLGLRYEFYGPTMNFLENHYAEQYAKLDKDQVKDLQGLSSTEIQWLYVRSLFNYESDKVSDYYNACLKKDWTKHSLQVQAMAGVYFLNSGQIENADLILKSILNRKTTKKNLGTFWNQKSSYYSWDQNSIETQAILIDFFNRMKVDATTIGLMKLWLLNQKRGQAWESSKATSLACYAMLVGDKPVSNISKVPTVKVGNKEIDASTAAKNLGYVKQMWRTSEIDASMGKMTVVQTEDEPAFGSLTLIYTDEIAKIQKNTSGVTITKKMYLIIDGKETLITPQTELKLGDLVRVRLQVENDQALEFVHIKDTKASGSENVETLSGHKSAGNMYYYQVVHDASTDFFLDNLPRGKHHLTYDLRISGKGIQSTGYASVECMYAPEFRANSSSSEIQVK